MPVTYDLHKQSGFIHTRCMGEVTLAEVMRHFEELASDPSLPARLDVLLDLDKMRTLPTSDQVRSVAGRVEGLASTVKWGACAIVASRDAVYGMSRMFQVFTEERFAAVSVFREPKQAVDWLVSHRSAA